MLDDEEKPPPDVFSDLSTVLLSMDLRDAREDTEEGGEMEGTKGEQENRSVRIEMFERNKEIKEEGETGERLRGRR